MRRGLQSAFDNSCFQVIACLKLIRAPDFISSRLAVVAPNVLARIETSPATRRLGRVAGLVVRRFGHAPVHGYRRTVRGSIDDGLIAVGPDRKNTQCLYSSRVLDRLGVGRRISMGR